MFDGLLGVKKCWTALFSDWSSLRNCFPTETHCCWQWKLSPLPHHLLWILFSANFFANSFFSPLNIHCLQILFRTTSSKFQLQVFLWFFPISQYFHVSNLVAPWTPLPHNSPSPEAPSPPAPADEHQPVRKAADPCFGENPTQPVRQKISEKAPHFLLSFTGLFSHCCRWHEFAGSQQNRRVADTSHGNFFPAVFQNLGTKEFFYSSAKINSRLDSSI